MSALKQQNTKQTHTHTCVCANQFIRIWYNNFRRFCSLRYCRRRHSFTMIFSSVNERQNHIVNCHAHSTKCTHSGEHGKLLLISGITMDWITLDLSFCAPSPIDAWHNDIRRSCELSNRFQLACNLSPAKESLWKQKTENVAPIIIANARFFNRLTVYWK